jgi:hypothetical protein
MYLCTLCRVITVRISADQGYEGFLCGSGGRAGRGEAEGEEAPGKKMVIGKK